MIAPRAAGARVAGNCGAQLYMHLGSAECTTSATAYSNAPSFGREGATSQRLALL